MNFTRFLDIQSWWEVPSIAYFCSLFRTAFNLLDFDIEELEEALLTDGTEDSGSSLLTELIVRLLNGCLGNNDISAFNYQMYLRRLFRQKCQESGRYNPFNTDIDFQFLPLRRKVEILYALCDFRLDAEDVFDLFKNLEAESLRVEPLGWDDNDSAYWYFYGTRLYIEDIIRKPKGKKKKKSKNKKRGWLHGSEWNEDETERVWQVVCFTEEDWTNLTQKFSKATSKVEKELYRSLSQNFMPEIPRLFHEKERLQRKRLLELAPRRTSSRVLQKMRQEEENRKVTADVFKVSDSKESQTLARNNRANHRNFERAKPASSDSDSSEAEEMPKAKIPKQGKKKTPPTSAQNGEKIAIRNVRKTNNSLASATFQSDQIVIPENDEPVNSTRKKLKTSQIFNQTDEDIRTDMYKVLEQLTNHQDAWPFLDPVEEDYAPNYYSVIRRPMDLHTMEQRLDNGYYPDFATFKADFTLIVNNCRLYNGQDNEYTTMVDNLQVEFDRLTEKYMYHMSSSDEEIAVEYQLPTPTRRQKRKVSASPTPTQGKLKIQKTQIDDEVPKCSTSFEELINEDGNTTNDVTKASDEVEQDLNNGDQVEKEDSKACKKAHEKGKKRHRHGRHSKVHKKKLHGSKSKHSKKHSKRTGVDKKLKHKHKRTKRVEAEPSEPEPQMKRRESQESMTSSNNRSASPLPSIHTPSPSPTQVDKMESDGEANETTQNDPATYNAKSVSTVNCKVAEFTSRSSMERVWKSVLVNDIREKTLKNLNKKEKNQTLRETIEKLKTKNKKYRDPSLFTSLFTPRSGRRVEKKPYYKEDSEDDFSDDEALESVKAKCNNKKITKKNSTKTKSTSEALEEAVKDISKWLDEIPETSIVSPLSNSPAPTVSTEEQDSSSRQDDEVSVGEKTVPNRKDFTRKRPSSREPKLVKRREIQRTIDRLQPGKSKGNLLTNVPKSSDRVDDNSSSGYINSGDSNQTEEAGPKLNLGSVLPTVNFALQLTQDFNKDVLTEEKTTMVTKVTESESAGLATEKEEPPEVVVLTAKKDVEKENKAVVFSKPNQEKVTPNLSAWFKAFGAPKATGPVNCTKKKMKDAENEEKPAESESAEVKASPKLNSNKVDSPNNPNSPNHDGGDSSRTSSDTLVLTTQWPRRTSTGSSISEQSSFSQDLDSPRQLISHTSPLLRSPASPRSYDDYQKSYSAINGTVRAGFYQDTTSVKSSPDKICSPREAPHSPYSPCPQHVYSASATQRAATPNYFVDPNKSPLLTNSQTTSLYYEANKTSVPNKTPKPNDNLSLVSPSLYSPTQTNYTQNSSHLPLNSAQAQSNLVNETKTTFPMKKRMYNELEQPQAAEPPSQQQQTAPCAKLVNKIITQTPAINSIKQYHTALTEKCHLANREPKYTEHINDVYENVEQAHARKNPDVTEAFEIAMKNEAGMVNVNYFVSDESRQNNVTPDVEYFGREAKSSVSKTPRRYEIDSMSMESQQLPKPLSKPDIGSYNFIPAHSHERHNDMNMNKQTIAHAHQTPYDSLNQQIGGLCFNDIELANKKLYTNNISRTPLDYANWKATNQMRPQEHLPIDFSYINSNDKSLQQQQYYNYAVPRITSHKNQIINQIPSSELKIPNPRGMKSDVQSTLTKIPQDNPFMSSLSYKSPYTSHSTLLDSIKPMRNVNDNELYLSSFTNALYPTKQLEMAQVFGNTPGSSSIIYTQARNFIECDIKRIQKRLRKTMESKQTASSQAYAASSSGNNALRSEKRSSLLRPTLCEFGSTNMNIDGMYANDPIYNIGNIRNSTDQVMAANYMAEAVASQRNNGASAEKFLQPANQSSHSGSFPFIAHSQLGAGYPYVNTEASSPLYQQYVQHYQDMQRQTGAQIMGLYPPTYPPTLSVRQPYDSTDPSSSK